MSEIEVHGGRIVYTFKGKKYVEAINAEERAIAQLVVGKHLLVEIKPSSQETKVAPEVSPPSESILDEAKRLVCGDRQASYGPPDQDFQRTADMINGLFKDYFKEGCEFKPKDVAAIMILIKLSRNRHQNKRDNPVDIAGYAHCMNVCMECEKKT